MGNAPSECKGAACSECQASLPPATSWGDLRQQNFPRWGWCYVFLNGSYYRPVNRYMYYLCSDCFRKSRQRVNEQRSSTGGDGRLQEVLWHQDGKFSPQGDQTHGVKKPLRQEEELMPQIGKQKPADTERKRQEEELGCQEVEHGCLVEEERTCQEEELGCQEVEHGCLVEEELTCQEDELRRQVEVQRRQEERQEQEQEEEHRHLEAEHKRLEEELGRQEEEQMRHEEEQRRSEEEQRRQDEELKRQEDQLRRQEEEANHQV